MFSQIAELGTPSAIAVRHKNEREFLTLQRRSIGNCKSFAGNRKGLFSRQLHDMVIANAAVDGRTIGRIPESDFQRPIRSLEIARHRTPSGNARPVLECERLNYSADRICSLAAQFRCFAGLAFVHGWCDHIGSPRCAGRQDC